MKITLHYGLSTKSGDLSSLAISDRSPGQAIVQMCDRADAELAQRVRPVRSWHNLTMVFPWLIRYPLVNVYVANWKITMLLMRKSTISTGPFSMSQTVNHYQRALQFVGAYSI